MSFSFRSKAIAPKGIASRLCADIGQIWRFPDRAIHVSLIMLGLMLSACGTAVAPDSVPAGNRGFAGVVVSQAPPVTFVARDVILSGGNAADAAAAMGLSLAVTLPSRAGLGGGGVCIVHDTSSVRSEGLEFIDPGSDPTPMLARGLAALQARYGTRPWSRLVAPAEALARFGFSVTKTLAYDLAIHGDVLMADQTALASFMDRRRQIVVAGSEIQFPRLAETLSQLRTKGSLALLSAAPQWRVVRATNEAGYVLMGRTVAGEAQAGNSSAATGFVVGDKNGLAVACVLTMGSMFGNGRMAPEAGYFIPAPSIGADLTPLIVKDAHFDQVVLMAVASGASAAALTRVTFDDWLSEAKSYDDMRSQVQQALAKGLDGALTAALCQTGLGVSGKDCRSLSDVRGFGLGLTFAPGDSQ